MFARLVTMKLKANSAEEFSRLIDNEVLHCCASRTDFVMRSPLLARTRASISLWDTQEDAVAYKARDILRS